MTSLRTGLAKDKGIITSAYINLRPKAEIDAVFLHYLLHSYDVKKVFYALGSGLRQNLSYTDFKYLRLPIPSSEEQRAITAFLDEKCAKVDEAVRIKEEQIALLRERRQILIQEAVTRGLNPAAPMKDSGVDWIGQIPSHWEVRKLRDVGRFQNGISQSAEYFGSGYPFVTYGDVFNNDTVPNPPSGLARSSKRDQSIYSVKRGDIFFTRTSETISEIGIACSCSDDMPTATFSGFLIRCRPANDLIDPAYARYVFRSQYVRTFFAREVNIITRASLGQDSLKNLPVFVPPLPEQMEIAAQIKTYCEKIDKAISIKDLQIAALKEYKTSLIDAAVTGKIKVA
jgi:type I restriction enzyme S subunit